MSQFIQDFRVKNPQYDDMPDDQLVGALHGKFYSDMPIEQFNQKIGFQSVVTPEPVQESSSLIDQQLTPEPLTQDDGQIASQEPIEPTGASKLFQMGVYDEPEPAESQSMSSLIHSKLSNLGFGVVERSGDVAGSVLQAVSVLGESLENKIPLGGIAVKEGDILPSIVGPKEWEQEGIDSALEKGGEILKGVDLGYEQQKSWDDVKKSFKEGGPLDGSAYADVFEYGMESGIKSIPDMVGAIYALPAYVLGRSAEIGEIRAKNKGKPEVEATDIMEAIPFAAGSALLERIGAKGITDAGKEAVGKEMLKAGVASVSKRVAAAGGKAIAKEATTEAIQEGMIEYVAEHYGTDAKMNFAEALDRAAAGAVAGGVFGGTTATGLATARELAAPSPQAEVKRALEAEVEAADISPTTAETVEAMKPDQILQPTTDTEVKAPAEQEVKAEVVATLPIEDEAISAPVEPVSTDEVAGDTK